MTLFKWGNDRFSHLGYKIFTLFYNRFLDVYIFKYEKGSYIPKHKDPKKYGAMYRLNVVLGDPTQFYCNGPHINIKNRFILFRADKYKHWTDKTKKRRFVLSIGVKLKFIR